MTNKFIAGGLSAALLLSTPLLAADTPAKTNAAEDTAKEIGKDANAIEHLALAYKLADYARASKDGQAMLVAARMASQVTVKPGTDMGKLSMADTAGKTAKVVSSADLYKEARALANGDQSLLEAIDASQASASKGAVGGAIGLARYVPSQATWTVKFNARGRERLLVGAQRDNATPIDLKVYDENDNLLCSDTSHDVVMTCALTPAWTGPFRIDLVNHGSYGSAVALLTN